MQTEKYYNTDEWMGNFPMDENMTWTIENLDAMFDSFCASWFTNKTSMPLRDCPFVKFAKNMMQKLKSQERDA